jgi:hypothetical protein
MPSPELEHPFSEGEIVAFGLELADDLAENNSPLALFLIAAEGDVQALGLFYATVHLHLRALLLEQ